MLVAVRRYGVSSRFIKGLAGGFQQYRRLLCADRERPCRSAADMRDELATPQCAPLKPRIAPYHIVEKAVLCITAFWPTRLPQWVIS